MSFYTAMKCKFLNRLKTSGTKHKYVVYLSYMMYYVVTSNYFCHNISFSTVFHTTIHIQCMSIAEINTLLEKVYIFYGD